MFKTYFCKIDDFPGVKVNPQGKLKPLAESCDFNLESPYVKAKKKGLKSQKKKTDISHSESYEWLRRHLEEEDAED